LRAILYLRRILTDYGCFVGFPLRKDDFPLSGYLECRYNLESLKVVCFRTFRYGAGISFFSIFVSFGIWLG